MAMQLQHQLQLVTYLQAVALQRETKMVQEEREKQRRDRYVSIIARVRIKAARE